MSATREEAKAAVIALLDSVDESLAEGIHTALRKACDSRASGEAWKAIRDMPDPEWGNAVTWATNPHRNLWLDKNVDTVLKALTPPIICARPLAEWREEMGDVMWWWFNEDGQVAEAPWVGSPSDLGIATSITVQTALGAPQVHTVYIGGWADIYTHFTPLPDCNSVRPAPTAATGEEKADG